MGHGPAGTKSSFRKFALILVSCQGLSCNTLGHDHDFRWMKDDWEVNVGRASIPPGRDGGTPR
jgi:hypothetical protein